MVKTLCAALLVASIAIPVSPAMAVVYDYTVNGSYTGSGDTTLFGSVITSGNTVSSIDITTPNFGSFLDILSQGSAVADQFYIITLENQTDTYKFTLVLDTPTNLFSGQPTTIDGGSSFEAVGTSGPSLGQPMTGTLTLAAAVPETSTWAMLILGFCSLGCLTYRRKQIGLLVASRPLQG
jgi:hypothetical protein